MGRLNMFDECYRNKKVLVTGNTGFKGSWLTSWLLALGAEVYGLSNGIPSTPAMFEVLNLKKRITYYEYDICNAAKVLETIDKIRPDFIFHLAAQPIVKVSYDDPLLTFNTNVMGTACVLEALRKINHDCIAVMITSDKCYENVEWCWGYRENDTLGGKDPYSASKASAEMVIKTYYHSFFKSEASKVRLVSVRAGNVIGGGDWAVNRIVPDCFRAWNEQNAVTIRSPRATRPWQHVLEPLSGYLRLGMVLTKRPELSGQAYNFGPDTNQTKTVLELIQEISKYWNFKQDEKMIVHETSNFYEAGLLKLSCDKALFDLAWTSTLNFIQTARFTSDWYNNFYNHQTDMYAFTLDQITEYVRIGQETAKGVMV